MSAALWASPWSAGPSLHASCGCGDPALTLWFLEWPAYALAHGHSPLFSSAAGYPGGVNLLTNTGMLALGIPLAPLTLWFGPVLALNVASVLAPVLAAAAMYWTVSRWVAWPLAAAAGGFVYGFSPFVLANDVAGHLNMAMLAVPPLIVAAAEQLLVKQTRRPVRVGAALGVLLVLQFFLSTELLVIVAMGAIVGLVLLVGHGIAVSPRDVARRARAATPGLVVAGTVAGGLLAYPTWYALAGPAHLSGRIWPTLPTFDTYTPASMVSPHAPPAWSATLSLWGYYGGTLPVEVYIGFGVVVVAGLGLLLFPRDRRLWFFVTLGTLTAWLALTTQSGLWTPWRLLDGLPILENVIQSRFFVVTLLCSGAVVAIVVDRSRVALRRHSDRRSAASQRRRVFPRVAVLAFAVAAVAVGPLAVAVAPAAPFATRRVEVPRWFASGPQRLPADAVVLVYPPPFSGVQSAMAWQAVSRMRYTQVGISGPQGLPGRAGAARPGLLVLDALSFNVGDPPAGTARQLRAVRRALRAWRVTTVVVPEQVGPPLFGQGRDPAYAAAFFAAVLSGQPAVHQDAWVWDAVDRAPSPSTVPAGTIGRCAGLQSGRGTPTMAVPDCVLMATAPGTGSRP